MRVITSSESGMKVVSGKLATGGNGSEGKYSL